MLLHSHTPIGGELDETYNALVRIAVNLLPFRARLGGAGRYAQNVLRALVAANERDAYLFFVNPRSAVHFNFASPKVELVPVALPESAYARIAYEQFVLPAQLSKHKPDVLFTPSVAIPLAWRGKKATVIYDMIAEHHDVTKYPRWRNAYVRHMTRYVARHSDAIITVSQTSRREIVQYARVPSEKIHLAPPGIDSTLQRVSDDGVLHRVSEWYRLPERFVLYLGALERGKNLVRLVQAYAQLKRAHPELEQHLVLAGAAGWGMQEIEKEIQQSGASGIHVIGFVDDDDLAALYSLADLVVYPSLYEGFGMPPLEAMACGTPVIASDVSALPEVVGDAGLLVSPYNVPALADAMARVLTDDDVRARLSLAGLARAQQFCWDASANLLHQVLNTLE